jgi:hypothetical protein
MNEFIQIDDDVLMQIFDYFIRELATNFLDDIHMIITFSPQLILQDARLHLKVILVEISCCLINPFLIFLKLIIDLHSHPSK